MTDDLTLERARELDARDPLAAFRSRFTFADDDLIYLDGNSLGRLPDGVSARVQQAVENEWGRDLIRSWNSGWWDAPLRIGERLAPLLGAAPGQTVVCDQTSLNLFKLAGAALRLRAGRFRIVTDTLNFPSDLYVLQGLVSLLGGNYEIVQIPSRDGDITPDPAALQAAIDDRTALVSLSHVTFKSGYLYDMGAVTKSAHAAGALVLWDLSHSVGAVPIELDDCDVDFAVGCTYKYLNGGPGAPAFLYVNHRLQAEAVPPIWGWWGDDKPFEFGLAYRPADGVRKFLTGTTPILAMIALESGLAPLLEAGIKAIRAKSIALTEFAIELSDQLLSPLGFALGSPRDERQRGSHISLRHADGYRINRALIEDVHVIPDFRAPDNLRLGFAPLYVSFEDAWQAINRLRGVVVDGLYEKYPAQRLTVT